MFERSSQEGSVCGTFWPYLLLLVPTMLSGCGPAAPTAARFTDLELQDFAGNRTPADKLRGKTLVINFWATWCAPCREEMPSLQRLSRVLASDRYAVLGISVDEDARLAEEFLLSVGTDFPVFHDPEQHVAQRFGVTIYPTTLIAGPSGTILEIVEGDIDWGTEEVADRIRALSSRHSN